jgi:hypothetical protein
MCKVMTDPSQPSVDGSVCVQCGARMAAGAPWCTLCYAVPGAETEPATRPEDGDVPQRVAGVSPAERRHLRADSASPDSASPDSEDVDAIAAQMLAQLAAERPAPSRLGALAPSLSSPVARAAAGAAGVVLFSLLVFGLMALLGTLL